MRIARRRAVAMSALVATRCGALPPQAPLPEAKKLDNSTSGIASACGLSYQLTAFPGDHRRALATLEATASTSARKLASVYRRDPAWIYQGETIAVIVKDATSALDDCGLSGARTVLLRVSATHS
jgi:hypothetical protein